MNSSQREKEEENNELLNCYWKESKRKQYNSLWAETIGKESFLIWLEITEVWSNLKKYYL